MNDVNVSECKFSLDIVPYMYGELSRSESSTFESHLLNCGECTDEFAAVSSARYEVYEWKKLEFDPLSTPEIEIPYEKEIILSSGSSWFDKLSALADGWAVPGLAFGALAVSIFAAAFLLSRDGGDVAAVNDNSNIPAVKSSTVETGSEKPEAASPGETKNEDNKQGEALPIRISTPARGDQRRVVRNVRAVQPRALEVKATSAQNSQKRVPTLNEFVEDEDTSLRLAELFEDIETSD